MDGLLSVWNEVAQALGSVEYPPRLQLVRPIYRPSSWFVAMPWPSFLPPSYVAAPSPSEHVPLPSPTQQSQHREQSRQNQHGLVCHNLPRREPYGHPAEGEG